MVEFTTGSFRALVVFRYGIDWSSQHSVRALHSLQVSSCTSEQETLCSGTKVCPSP